MYASIEQEVSSPGGDAAGGASSAAVVVEARLTWGRDVLAVRHLAPRRELTLRDLGLGLDVGGDDSLVVARRDEHGDVALRLPSGAPVPPSAVLAFRFGRATLRLRVVPDDTEAEALQPQRTTPIARLVAVALPIAMAGAMVLAAAPPSSRTEAEERALMRLQLAAADVQAAAELAASRPLVARPVEGAARAAPAAERTRCAVVDMRLPSGKSPAASSESAPPATSPAAFGMVALVADHGGRHSRFSATKDAAREMFAPRIHEAIGAGTLELSGVGEGGGGRGSAL